MNEYPLHDKVAAIQDKVSLLSEFLDWLEENKIFLAEWENEELFDIYESKESIIARFFGINLKEFHAEKDRMLDAMRQFLTPS